MENEKVSERLRSCPATGDARGASPIAALYTYSEVAWLNSISYEDAIAADADPGCPLAFGPGPAGEVSLPVIVRWRDVQNAKKRLGLTERVASMARLLAEGCTERDVARIFKTSQPTVHRHTIAAIRDLVGELNHGLTPPAETRSHVALCLNCGRKPRVLLAATKHRVHGGWKIVEPEKQASVCEECLVPELLERVARPTSRAA